MSISISKPAKKFGWSWGGERKSALAATARPSGDLIREDIQIRGTDLIFLERVNWIYVLVVIIERVFAERLTSDIFLTFLSSCDLWIILNRGRKNLFVANFCRDSNICLWCKITYRRLDKERDIDPKKYRLINSLEIIFDTNFKSFVHF